MKYILSIAITSLLAQPLAAWGGEWRHGEHSTSKGGRTQTGGHHPTKGSGKKLNGQQDKRNAPKPPPWSHPKNAGGVGKNPGPKHAWAKSLKGVGKNPNVGGSAQGAINNLLSGNFLSPAERQDLNNLV